MAKTLASCRKCMLPSFRAQGFAPTDFGGVELVSCSASIRSVFGIELPQKRKDAKADLDPPDVIIEYQVVKSEESIKLFSAQNRNTPRQVNTVSRGNSCA